MPFIVVDRMAKSFRTQRPKGIASIIKSAFKREMETMEAIQEISFSVEAGEMLGIIGPGSAGKTVLLKILAGILAPSSGGVLVNGLAPSKNQKQNAMRIGAVFDEKTHLHWKESVDDIFRLHQTMYQIPAHEFRRNRSRLIELFDLGAILNQTAERLTGGEKMKANIALAMLHNPDALYLDEPMRKDTNTTRILREGIRTINEEWNTAILFSTRVMEDIAAVCERMLLLDEGTLLYDGGYGQFAMQYQMDSLIAMEFDTEPQWREHHRFSLVRAGEGRWIVRPAADLSRKDAFLALSHLYNPQSISVCAQRIDDVMENIRKGLPEGSPPGHPPKE